MTPRTTWAPAGEPASNVNVITIRNRCRIAPPLDPRLRSADIEIPDQMPCRADDTGRGLLVIPVEFIPGPPSPRTRREIRGHALRDRVGSSDQLRMKTSCCRSHYGSPPNPVHVTPLRSGVWWPAEASPCTRKNSNRGGAMRKRFLAVITLTLLAGSPAGAQVVRGVMTLGGPDSA